MWLINKFIRINVVLNISIANQIALKIKWIIYRGKLINLANFSLAKINNLLVNQVMFIKNRSEIKLLFKITNFKKNNYNNN